MCSFHFYHICHKHNYHLAVNLNVFIVCHLTVPGQPENFAGQAISATEIQLTWTMRDNVQITRYELYYNTSSSGSEEQYRAISPSNSFILNNLSPNTLYHIRLAASSTNGVGASTSVISIRTEQSGKSSD